jgi:hypothetical protein
MKRIVMVAIVTVSAAASAAAAQRQVRARVVTTRTSVEAARSWQTAGSLVELASYDPASRTVRIAVGDREQTLIMSEASQPGFQALAAGGPVFLSWRFNRQARPEATLRIVTSEGGGTVSMVGWPAETAGR